MTDGDTGCMSYDYCNLLSVYPYDSKPTCGIPYGITSASNQPGLKDWLLGPWTVDTIKPSETIANPTSGSSFFGDYTASGYAGDSFGIKTLTLQIDNGPVIVPTVTVRATNPAFSDWNYPINATTTTNGTHTMTITAKDPTGNTTTSSVTFTTSGLQ